MKSIEELFKTGKFYIWEDKFSILQTKTIYPDAFANIVAKEETTVIVRERDATYKIPKKEIMSVDHGWKLITFDMKLAFEIVGFIARIATALADKEISIFVMSGYSTDHIMVKADQLEETQNTLIDLGFTKVAGSK